MPVLVITDGKGNLQPMASAIVHAITFHPQEDDPRQRQFLALTLAYVLTQQPSIVDDEDREQVALLLLGDVLHAPAMEDALRRTAQQAGNSWIAAEMLMMLLSAIVHHPEQQVNPTKVVFALSKLFHGEMTWGGRPATAAPRTIWKAWSRFKGVAHLHALRQQALRGQDRRKEPDLRDFAVYSVEELAQYLADAEFIRRAAVERQVLRYEETWRTPDDLVLPPARLRIPPLPSAALEVLAQYEPEFSREAGLEDL